mmetsp:Transcript_18524/g.39636  ORF Transcript_18524/g.39636 Transcript_18524/m.39636 type:complete len:234 (+) Transcript_18524:814-1515(+)
MVPLCPLDLGLDTIPSTFRRTKMTKPVGSLFCSILQESERFQQGFLLTSLWKIRLPRSARQTSCQTRARMVAPSAQPTRLQQAALFLRVTIPIQGHPQGTGQKLGIVIGIGIGRETEIGIAIGALGLLPQSRLPTYLLTVQRLLWLPVYLRHCALRDRAARSAYLPSLRAPLGLLALARDTCLQLPPRPRQSAQAQHPPDGARARTARSSKEDQAALPRATPREIREGEVAAV